MRFAQQVPNDYFARFIMLFIKIRKWRRTAPPFRIARSRVLGVVEVSAFRDRQPLLAQHYELAPAGSSNLNATPPGGL
jgi:hypothetical protein